MSTLVLTGGGTAGHVTACIAMLDYLRDRFSEIHYVGSQTGMERELMRAYPFVAYHAIPCAKLRRSVTLKNLTVPFTLMRGVHEAKKLLRSLKPDVIFSKGGYVSLPVALAAGKTPLVLHESDRSMGLANKLARKKASVLLSAFPIEGCEQVGAPLRPALYYGSAVAARARYGLTKRVLLVTGGSLGATAINTTLRKALPALTARYDVLHLTGKGQSDPNLLHPHYHQIEYAENPADLFACADVVVTRGGANTLFELAALQKPMLIVPLGAGSRGDQLQNAEYFSSQGLAHVLLQDALTPESLCQAVLTCDERSDVLTKNLASFHADGATATARKILQACGRAV